MCKNINQSDPYDMIGRSLCITWRTRCPIVLIQLWSLWMRVPSICRWWFKVGEVGRKAGRGEVQCDLQGSPLIISGVKLEPRSSEETIVIPLRLPEPHEPIEKLNKSLGCHRTTTNCYHTVELGVVSLRKALRITALHLWNSRSIPYPKFNLNYSIQCRSSVILSLITTPQNKESS
jgi:hypothetical protein